MDQIQKQWRKLSKKDHEKIRGVFKQLAKRNFSGLDRQRLKGYEHIYRVRIGNYRLIYFDDGKEVILKYLKKRNERTYREL